MRSAAKAFEKVSKNVVVTSNPADIKKATHIVLPGVGAFSDCMAGLKKLSGMIDTMKEEVLAKNKPFLGICVGMQLLAEKGYEDGVHDGLGWIKGEVRIINPEDKKLKVPHMGWNNIKINNSKLFKDIKDGEHLYFVHSYQVICSDNKDIAATVEYGGEITAAVTKNNIMGVQFHPEKSQDAGLKIIGNFLSL